MERSVIEELVKDYIADNEMFIVEIKISHTNKITVWVDTPQGVQIEECVALSRFLESKLDRDKEDYALEVSSPGLTEPLKVLPQYEKAIGKKISIVTADQQRLKGTLLEVRDETLLLETEKKEKGKKQTHSKQMELLFSDIDKAKRIMEF